MTAKIQTAKSILKKIRSTERKMCWLAGYLSNNVPDAELISSLEENSEALNDLEKDLINLIEQEENYERAIHSDKTDSQK